MTPSPEAERSGISALPIVVWAAAAIEALNDGNVDGARLLLEDLVRMEGAKPCE